MNDGFFVSEEARMLLRDYKTLFLFDIASSILGKTKLSDLELSFGSSFLYSIGFLRERIVDLNRMQMKIAVENIKIVMYEKGTMLLQK